MARKGTSKKSPKGRRAAKKKSRSGLSALIMVAFAIGGFAVISPGAAGAIFLCMLPTFMLLLSDSDGLQSLRAQCVGYLSAAASLQFVYDIYTGKTAFIAELMELKILLLPWGAAAIGTFLVYIAPAIAASYLQLKADENLKKLNVHRDKLIEEWGKDVMGIQDERGGL